MSFKFSRKSEARLNKVNPALADICSLALDLSGVDFGIICGLRTPAEQMKLYKSGASHTLDSKHLTGDAVDVAAVADGLAVWEAEPYALIAEAFRGASRQLAIPVRWGGAWSVPRLGDAASARQAMRDYIDNFKFRAGRPFLDLGHFEINQP